MVVLGGVASYGLATMKQVMVYDPSSNSWSQQNVAGVNGMYPSTTADHVAVVSKFNIFHYFFFFFKKEINSRFFFSCIDSDDQIIIFGGWIRKWLFL